MKLSDQPVRCAKLVENSENLKSQQWIHQLIAINSFFRLLAAIDKITWGKICKLHEYPCSEKEKCSPHFQLFLSMLLKVEY